MIKINEELENRYITNKSILQDDIRDGMKMLKKMSLDKVVTEIGYSQKLNRIEMQYLRYQLLNRIGKKENVMIRVSESQKINKQMSTDRGLVYVSSQYGNKDDAKADGFSYAWHDNKLGKDLYSRITSDINHREFAIVEAFVELPAQLFKVGDIITPDFPKDKYELYEVTEVSDEYDKYNGYKYIIVPANDHTKELCMNDPNFEGDDIDDGFEMYGFEGQPDDCGFELANLDALGFIPFKEVDK